MVIIQMWLKIIEFSILGGRRLKAKQECKFLCIPNLKEYTLRKSYNNSYRKTLTRLLFMSYALLLQGSLCLTTLY